MPFNMHHNTQPPSALIKLDSKSFVDWLHRKYPMYSVGTIKWLAIPVAIRHIIFNHHLQWWNSLPQRSKPPRALPPLAYVCRLFRQEFRGMLCSRKAVFKSEALFMAFNDEIKKRSLSTYLHSITLDLISPDNELYAADKVRSFFNLASQELQWIGAITILARVGQQPLAPVFDPLLRDGTIAQFKQLQVMGVRDIDLEATWRSYDPREKRFVLQKMDQYQREGGIKEPLNSELRMTAARLLKCNEANLNFAFAIRSFRRDSVLEDNDLMESAENDGPDSVLDGGDGEHTMGNGQGNRMNWNQ